MRSLICLLERRTYGPKNFRSAVQKDFCNNIGRKSTLNYIRSTSATQHDWLFGLILTVPPMGFRTHRRGVLTVAMDGAIAAQTTLF